MRKAFLVILMLTLILTLLSAGCVPGEIATPTFSPAPTRTVESTVTDTLAIETVQGLVAEKLDALEAKDIDRYLALIDATDEEFYTEQRNWFLYYQEAVTSDFSIEVLSALQLDDSTIVASLHQHYHYGPEKEDRTVTYAEKYILTPNGWKDADLDFRVHETPHYLIKYTQGVEARAVEVGEQAEIAYESVVDALGLEPGNKITIKLFADQEMLRQNTDIRIAYLFSGWGESGESIKMYAYRDIEAIPRVVAHETVHKLTLEITDSQPSWFAEGLATCFGNQPLRGGNPLELGWYPLEELAQPISWLEEKNLTRLTDENTINLYYSISGMVIEFIVDTYGLDKVHLLLGELSQYPDDERGYDFSMEPELQRRLYQGIEEVLGLDREAFNQQWLAWIRSL